MGVDSRLCWREGRVGDDKLRQVTSGVLITINSLRTPTRNDRGCNVPNGTLPKRYPIQKSKSNRYAGYNCPSCGHNATHCRPSLSRFTRAQPTRPPHLSPPNPGLPGASGWRRPRSGYGSSHQTVPHL